MDVNGDEGEDEGQYDEDWGHDLGEGRTVGEAVVVDLLLQSGAGTHAFVLGGVLSRLHRK